MLQAAVVSMSPDPRSTSFYSDALSLFRPETNNAPATTELFEDGTFVAGTALHRKFKIVILGNSGVGKTSIICCHKYGESDACSHSATIGASYVNCDIVIDENPLQLQIWDTAGQERFRCMVPMYMRNAAAAIIVYDITCRKSFEEVDKWISELHRCSDTQDPLIVLIGNKADLEVTRQVTSGEGLTKAAKLNARFFEISAYDHESIASVFDILTHAVHQRLSNVRKVSPAIAASDSIYRLKSIKTLDRKNRLSKKINSKCCNIQ